MHCYSETWYSTGDTHLWKADGNNKPLSATLSPSARYTHLLAITHFRIPFSSEFITVQFITAQSPYRAPHNRPMSVSCTP